MLVLDTSVEGWRVVYANESWKLWTGFGRDQAVGKPLAQLIEPAGIGRPRVDWGGLRRAVQEGARTVLHCMRAVGENEAAAAAEGASSLGAVVAAGGSTEHTAQTAHAAAAPTAATEVDTVSQMQPRRQ